ncbi:MAG TPA: MmcQ/YjbR family DNA-binding protein [Bacteroidia bacterium]|jgi:predicted DNA-binding protein (MmcQ/YjbR family)|nr:MmcQ/YjbR family DNA-binding protein [Bacteroidia bacterium]
MNIEDLRTYCLSFKGATEDIKWEADLCFCVGEKMFCVAPLEGEFAITFKVRPEEFEELSTSKGFMPAPYLARNKWVRLKDVSVLNRKELEGYIKQSYELISSKLPKKKLK